MEAIKIRSHVEVDNVAFLQRSCVGNAVTNNLIDRGAAATREVIVVSWRWIGSLRDDVVVHNFINLLCCHTWCDGSMPCIESLASDAADFAKLS